MKIIGSRIKEVRKGKGMTQEELAELSKMNLRTIQRIENNETTPRGNSLNAIYEVLQIDSEVFSDHTKEKGLRIARLMIGGVFLIALNISMMALFGFLTLDTSANWNSRLGALLLSVFIPIVIVFYTKGMNGLTRVLKFGTGMTIYMVMALILLTFPEPIALMKVLVPSIIIYLAILYYGNTILARTIEE